jgi:predicted nucleic acid-binding protein
MIPVFADTSYYITLLSEGDAYHREALNWSENLLGRTILTEYVLVELGNALSRSKQRDRYAPLVEHLLSDPDTVCVPASLDLFRQGLQLFAARPDKAWAMVDCISFVVMKQRRLKEALTTDRHFKQAGFKALLRKP